MMIIGDLNVDKEGKLRIFSEVINLKVLFKSVTSLVRFFLDPLFFKIGANRFSQASLGTLRL